MNEFHWSDYYDSVQEYADNLVNVHGLEGFSLWSIEESLKINGKLTKAFIFWWGCKYDHNETKGKENE